MKKSVRETGNTRLASTTDHSTLRDAFEVRMRIFKREAKENA